MEEGEIVVVKCKGCGKVRGDDGAWYKWPDDFLEQYVQKGCRNITIVPMRCSECSKSKNSLFDP